MKNESDRKLEHADQGDVKADRQNHKKCSASLKVSKMQDIVH